MSTLPSLKQLHGYTNTVSKTRSLFMLSVLTLLPVQSMILGDGKISPTDI
ncbi:MAG: hypothetical protein IKH75_12065 [Ruminococcus sp.]|nr:hypothetical protein [Ruminococcus sp.]